MGVESRGVELVALEPEPGQRRRPRDRAVVPPAEAHDRPAALGHAPDEPASGRHPVRQIDDPVRIHGRLGGFPISGGRGKIGLDAGMGGVGRPGVQGLLLMIGDHLPGAAGVGKASTTTSSYHSSRIFFRSAGTLPSPKNGFIGAGTGRRASNSDGPWTSVDAADEVGHRLLRPDPRPAAPGPARPGAHDQADAEPLRLPDGVGEEILPCFAHQAGFAPRDPDIDFEEEDVSDPGLLHRLEVPRDPLPVGIAVHEIPIDPRTRRVRRVEEAFSERVPGRALPRRHRGTADHKRRGQDRRNPSLFHGRPFREKLLLLYTSGKKMPLRKVYIYEGVFSCLIAIIPLF